MSNMSLSFHSTQKVTAEACSQSDAVVIVAILLMVAGVFAAVAIVVF